MKRTLILSRPIFDTAPFRVFSEQLLSPKSSVFVVNYANEPHMLKIRFHRESRPEITKRHYDELTTKLVSFGVRVENIFFSQDDDSYEDFIQAFHKANVLIFCGGASENLLDKLEELAVGELIRNTEKPIIAYSAGAEVLLDNLLLLPSSFWPHAGDYYQGYSQRKAIGRIHHLVLSFHYTPDKAKWMREAADFANHTIQALSDNGGLFCEDEHQTWIGEHALFSRK